MPLAERAAVSALAPGTAKTGKPSERTRSTSSAPGSLTPGVPASLASATALPSRSRATMPSAALRSLCSCNAITRAAIPKCASSPFVTRVSSAATTSQAASVSRARAVMSPRFPMGVATTYNPAGNDASRPSAGGEPESPLLPSPFARFNAILLAALFAASPAFSADPPRETTSPTQPPAASVATPLTQVPLPTARPERTTAPAAGAPAQPSAPAQPTTTPASAPVPKREPIAEGPAPHVALILPTLSALLGSVADAVRQGYFAASEADGRNALPVRLYATADDGPAVLESCRKAQKDGAVLVVAGLTRDGASLLAQSDCPRQPTLVLNQPQERQLPPRMYSISLGAEQEARQAALLAINDGWVSAIVITSPSPLSQRVHEAFEREWSRAAGELRRLVFTGGPDDAPVIKDRLSGMQGDMVFLALDRTTTLAVRPYISATLPVYTTSLSVDPRADATVNLDLEGVRYVDMPWFVQPDHPAVMVYPAPRNPMSVEQERLYAFGIDAYRLCSLLLQSDARTFSLDGVTGRISLEADRHFVRTLVPAGIDEGRAVALPGAR